MARDKNSEDFIGPIRRLLVGLLVLALVGLFLVWRIDSPRVERLRAAIVDAVVPSFDWAMAPMTGAANLVSDFQSYQQWNSMTCIGINNLFLNYFYIRK